MASRKEISKITNVVRLEIGNTTLLFATSKEAMTAFDAIFDKAVVFDGYGCYNGHYDEEQIEDPKLLLQIAEIWKYEDEDDE